MSLINLSVKHGKTLEEARTRLELTVNEVRARFGASSSGSTGPPTATPSSWPAPASSSRFVSTPRTST